MNRLAFLLAIIALAAPARAGDQTWHCMAPDAVGKHEVKTDALVLGEIKLSQRDGELTNLPVIWASFTAQNQSSKDFHVAMEILGSNDKDLIFAMSVRPAFAGTVSPMSNQPATDAVFSAAGELARATQICVRFVGDF